MSSAPPETRELAARENDGLWVLLVWHQREDELTVSAQDSRAGRCCELSVAPGYAVDACYHPVAYAA